MATGDENRKPMNSFYWEESNVQLNGALPDLKVFKKHCAALCETLHVIWEQKKSGEKLNPTDFITHLIAIKELNRLAQFRIRKARDNTLEQKLNLDKSHLSLQNLLYEVAHLENEITTCLEFKSQHENIKLIPVEEFYEVTQRVPHSLGNHEETLERLYWELEQRKSLSVACDELRKSVNSDNDEITKKRDYLASFSPKLKELSESTLAAQELMNLPFTKEENQYSMAFLLPAPLYVLYSRMKSYITMTGMKSGTVEIVGDAQLAKAINSMLPASGTNSDTATALLLGGVPAGVMETESDGEETDELKKRKQSRHKNKPASVTGSSSSHKKLTSLHPLSVVLTLTHSSNSTTSKVYNVQLTISFSWLPSVGLVTVRMLFETLPDGAHSPTSQSASDLLHSEHLLSNLYWSTDTRSNQQTSSSDLPLLPSTTHDQHQIQQYQWNACSPLGRPYAWAQELCSSHCFPEYPPAVGPTGTPPTVASQHNPFGLLEAWLQAVERRLTDRLALIDELEAIETGRPLLSAEQQTLLPPTIPTENGVPITHWRRATFEQLQAVPRAQVPISLGLIQSADAVFRCQFRLSTPQTATVWITVPTEYPQTAALLMVDGLLTPSNGQESNLDLSDLHLQELETEVNCYWSEFMSHRLLTTHQSFADSGTGQSQLDLSRPPQQNILSCQLARCAACLETLCHHSQQSPFVTPRGIKYPTRSRPLRYLPVTRTFAHR